MLIRLLVVADTVPFGSAMESHRDWICLFYSQTERNKDIKSVYHSYYYTVFIYIKSKHKSFSILNSQPKWYQKSKRRIIIEILNRTFVINWLPKTGWASCNAARRRCPAAPSIMPKSGGQLSTLPTRHLHPRVTTHIIHLAIALRYLVIKVINVGNGREFRIKTKIPKIYGTIRFVRINHHWFFFY